jgi:dTDP-4-dehydrorhamnose reductase
VKSPERVLITGGGGQLASDLEQVLAEGAEVSALRRNQLDVTDDVALASAFERLQPSAVYNCAAFHNVDKCESEEATAFTVNARAVKRLAERCADSGAMLIHMSTNYIFDGTRPEPYGEADLPNPRSVYAISKLAGEHAALAYAPGALVVRTAGLYGQHGSASKGGNFVVRMSARAREQGRLAMVADQLLSPTYTADLAEAIVEAVASGQTGVLHLTNAGSCSWFEFTQAIVDLAGIEAELEQRRTERAEGGADRPLNGVLARPAADAAGLTPLREWREALADYMDRAGLTAASAGRRI